MYNITQEQLEKVVNYLVSKPFVEVFQLVAMLQSLQKVEKVPEKLPEEIKEK
jgi:hypothetical protein